MSLLVEVPFKYQKVNEYNKRLRSEARYKVKAKSLILNIKEIQKK